MWKRENAIYFFAYWFICFLLQMYVPIFGDAENPTKIGIIKDITSTLSLIIGVVLLFAKDKDKKSK